MLMFNWFKPKREFTRRRASGDTIPEEQDVTGVYQMEIATDKAAIEHRMRRWDNDIERHAIALVAEDVKRMVMRKMGDKLADAVAGAISEDEIKQLAMDGFKEKVKNAVNLSLR